MTKKEVGTVTASEILASYADKPEGEAQDAEA